jgi:hypothetical protein
VHPLYAALAAAADGTFPPVDGLVEVCEPDESGTVAAVEFTGHSFVLTSHTERDVLGRGANGFGGSTHPDLLRWLAGPDGTIGSHDAVLVGRGRGAGGQDDDGSLRERTDLDDHPRVARARHHRRDVRVLGDERGLVTLGTGLVGRREMSVELFDPQTASRGAGRELIRQALGLVPADAPVWAQVAPGNAASLRAFLRCGFVPIGAEVLIDARSVDPPAS